MNSETDTSNIFRILRIQKMELKDFAARYEFRLSTKEFSIANEKINLIAWENKVRYSGVTICVSMQF